ncbi:hypothetical protein FNV43_RR21873 [Rhamnella rubrinervis]|uniref:Uncharacterized protein n=1 Tax=Rhamnella rubrinervis TaxID=2594499 RepID=A0A8K0GML8_9ROSA|nr:hypothetical protein FNV43_RR21873 [Rhamnella rubrinervis]
MTDEVGLEAKCLEADKALEEDNLALKQTALEATKRGAFGKWSEADQVIEKDRGGSPGLRLCPVIWERPTEPRRGQKAGHSGHSGEEDGQRIWRSPRVRMADEGDAPREPTGRPRTRSEPSD